jgi:IclR family acetate operon transcriptional repressor
MGYTPEGNNMKRNLTDDSIANRTNIYLVPAVDKALRILFLLRKTKRDMSVIEMAEETGLNKSTVHKLALTLQYHGVLERDEVSKRYSLGIVLVSLGQTVLKTLDVRRLAEPFLKELVDYAQETAILSIVRGTKVVIVDVKECKQTHRIIPIIGDTTPATATSSGKVLLAWLPERKVNEILQTEGLPALTKKSITDPKVFWEDLATIRKRGYATNIEESHAGLCGVSAPSFNTERKAVAALSIVGPAYRTTEKEIARFGKKCAETASRLSKKLP